MRTAVHAILLLGLLILLAFLMAQVGTMPLPVVATVGDLTLTTTAPVAAVLLLAALLAAFYLGRFTGWLRRLFRRIPTSHAQKKRESAAETFADAFAAYELSDFPTMEKHLNTLGADPFPTDPSLTDVHTTLSIATSRFPPAALEKYLTYPRLAPLAALHLARHFAAKANWKEVLRVTTAGREHNPRNTSLLTLQFKALVNTGNPEAQDLLPALKPLLGPKRLKLITTILAGPTSLTARPVLEDPFTRTFQAWLDTPAETWPAAND